MPRWYDDGIRVNLAVSESGDFVSLGTRTEYPFVDGGGGIPVSWFYYTGNGGATNDVYWTCANGRFSVSNANATNSNQNKTYGIWRTYPVTYGHRYLVPIQVRTMDTKANTKWTFSYQFNATGPAYGMGRFTQSEWEQLTTVIVPPDSSVTSIRINAHLSYQLQAGEVERFDWGGQWQAPALVDMLGTYPEPVWHDVTCDVNSLSVAYGRSQFTGRFEVATAQIGVINNDGEFTYQTSHPWGLRPGRFVKVTITDSKGTVYPTYYGLIDSIDNSYPIDGRASSVLNCIDIGTLLSNTTVGTGTSDTTILQSGSRFRGVLDMAGWAPQMRTYDPGVYNQQGVFNSGRNYRDEIGLGADSEGAFFWCDRNGILTFRDRNYLTNSLNASTVQAELMAECPVYIDEVLFRFPGVNGNGMTVAYESAFAFPSWLFAYGDVSFDDINSAARQTIVGQDGRWEFRKANGSKALEFSNGVSSVTSTIGLPFNSGDRIQVQVSYNRSSGAVTFYYSNGTAWVKLGNTMTITGIMPTANGAIRIGGNGATYLTPLKGRMYYVTLSNGSSDVLKVDRDYVPNTEGQTILSMPTGQIVNVAQTGTNVIVQVDPLTTPYRLAPIDGIANAAHPAVQHLKALETDWSRDRVVNQIQIANQGGGAFEKIDTASQQKYGPQTYQRLDFLNDNAHPEYNLERINDLLNGFTEAILRVNRVTFVPDLNTYPWVLSMWLLDLVRIRYQHPTAGWGFAVATHIQGYVHNLTMQGWETSLNLDQPVSFVYWNRPPNDAAGWDIDYWDQGIWDNSDPNATYWTSGQVWSAVNSKWSE